MRPMLSRMFRQASATVETPVTADDSSLRLQVSPNDRFKGNQPKSNPNRRIKRKAAYVDLIKTSRKVVGYARRAVDAIQSGPLSDPLAMALGFEIVHYAQLTVKVIAQTERRVIHGESVDAKDKVVSLFEPHTDIIVKDRRDTLFGHKICLTGGVSNLILDCLITEVNPADTDAGPEKKTYGRYPLKASFDGGFASKTNLRLAKSRKIKDVCFAKKRGLSVSDMCRILVERGRCPISFPTAPAEYSVMLQSRQDFQNISPDLKPPLLRWKKHSRC